MDVFDSQKFLFYKTEVLKDCLNNCALKSDLVTFLRTAAVFEYSYNAVCDELLSDSFPYKEIQNGILWEVEGKWVVQGAVDVDIGANPSAEGGEDEGVDDQAIKEQPTFDKKQFVTYIKRYIKNLTPKLPEDRQEEFKKNVEGAAKWLISKLRDLQFFVGESMHDDGCLVFAYYKEGSTDPTFLYFADGLKEVKC
eukprot:Gb_32417 [translate_table: standard]